MSFSKQQQPYEGEEVYLPFVEAINQRIPHYRNVLLQREDINKKSKEEQGNGE